MHEVVTFANHFVIYSACYTVLAVIYGYITYNLIKFIIRILNAAYKTVRSDITEWKHKKTNREKR